MFITKKLLKFQDMIKVVLKDPAYIVVMMTIDDDDAYIFYILKINHWNLYLSEYGFDTVAIVCVKKSHIMLYINVCI